MPRRCGRRDRSAADLADVTPRGRGRRPRGGDARRARELRQARRLSRRARPRHRRGRGCALRRARRGAGRLAAPRRARQSRRLADRDGATAKNRRGAARPRRRRSERNAAPRGRGTAGGRGRRADPRPPPRADVRLRPSGDRRSRARAADAADDPRPRRGGDRLRLPRLAGGDGPAPVARQGEDPPRRRAVPHPRTRRTAGAARRGAGGDLRRLRPRLGAGLRRRSARAQSGGRGDLARPARRIAGARRAGGARPAGADALRRFAPRGAPRRRRPLRSARRAGREPMERGGDRRSRAAADRRQRQARAGPLPARGGDPVRPRRAPSWRRDRLAGDRRALRRALRADRLEGRRGQPRRGDRRGAWRSGGAGAARSGGGRRRPRRLPVLLGGARRALRPRRPQGRGARRLPPRDRPRIRPGDARLPARAAGGAGVTGRRAPVMFGGEDLRPRRRPTGAARAHALDRPVLDPRTFLARQSAHPFEPLRRRARAGSGDRRLQTQRLRLPPALRAFPRPLRLADRRHPRLPLQRLHHADRRRAARDGDERRRAVAHPRRRPAARLPAAEQSETGPELARRARDAGAFVAIAHPAWSQLTEDDGRALDAAHAVEIYNHGCAVETDRGDGFYLLDRLCNLGRRLTAIATDDAHFNHGERDAFGGFVEVKAESLDPEALLAALKAGHFYASQGPRLHDVRVGRDEIVVETSPVDAVALLTGTSRALHVAGSHITRAVFDLAGAAKKAWTETGPDAWFRVVAIDAAGRRAWTNPIWLDALG